MLLYAIALNRSIASGLSNPSGKELVQFARGTFEGFTGSVTINEHFTRDALFMVYGLDSNDQQIVLMTISEEMINMNTSLLQEINSGIDQIQDLQPASVIWAHHGGSPPRNRPLCDYDGSACPPSFVEKYLAITLVAIIAPITIAIVAVALFLRYQRIKYERLNEFWKIQFDTLEKRNTKGYLKVQNKLNVLQMKSTEHENLCDFIGLSINGLQLLSVWKYCSRGSLKDVIEKGAMQMDWFFKYSLMRDVSERTSAEETFQAINFLHHSSFGAHGWLSSKNCLVDERWKVKIAFFGLDSIKMKEDREQSDILWVAPEHIRDPLLAPTQMGDIYSFGIICSEVITKTPAWDLQNQDYDIDELVYKLKRGGRSPIRPKLNTEEDQNSSMSALVKDCWSEEPDQRPSSDQIQARMKELTEEKKKSDILLYRMLPKQVAEKLKLGQSVEPEVFECATLFFSDVVSFTTLAKWIRKQKIFYCCQVIGILNDLYTLFDAIIEEHDVYKVETIGDGYLCASGLPLRNGNEHAKEIAEMSFELLRAIKDFRIPHLPNERVNIRVGIHTGSVVTGVVGITMPRYCLFGDTVNTASRMESNGKPGRVHISTDTMTFLTQVIGGYKTEPRGEVIIKAKGAVETHWLLTPEEQDQSKH
uniref:Guanylate cyclase n=1 Tax=Angiostrongylus cantonensis TaxID=6313 RepID=A0A158P7J9_ANGCA